MTRNEVVRSKNTQNIQKELTLNKILMLEAEGDRSIDLEERYYTLRDNIKVIEEMERDWLKQDAAKNKAKEHNTNLWVGWSIGVVVVLWIIVGNIIRII